MKKFATLLLILLFSSTLFSKCGSDPNDYYYIGFWNLENLFDTSDDPDKEDEEFLPSGSNEWTQDRLERKMYNLARVIRLMNDNSGPDILGVCEVEHTYLLDSMSANFLSDLNYKSVGIESPDGRGIDNALIYKSDRFQLLSFSGDTVKLQSGFHTRLILQVELLSVTNDTLHIFVNHFPSRRGGQKETESHRIEAARTLRQAVDRVFAENSEAKIFIIGDFNDEPTDESILNTLNAAPFRCDSIATGNFTEDNQSDLFNTSYELYEEGAGSYKFRDEWSMIDQIIISRELLTGSSLRYECGSYEIHKPEVMVTRSGKYEGAPFPTFGGRRYLGGYSDHFAVGVKIKILR